MSDMKKIEEILKKITKQANSAYSLIKRALKYLRINDDNNMVSLTNLAMILILYKIAVTAASSMEDIGLLLAVLSSYQAKRWLELKNKVSNKEEE